MSKSSKRKHQLPVSAKTFLATSGLPGDELLLVEFHRWLRKQKLPLSQLKPSQVYQFFELSLECVMKRDTAHSTHYYRCRLVNYLGSLRAGRLTFNPEQCRFLPDRIPKTVCNFIDNLSTLKPTTRRLYYYNLTNFHDWLNQQGISLRQIRRHHMVRWFSALADASLAPVTRIGKILNVRLYLRWLAENRIVRKHPDDLVRSTDIPKRPDYLPRPLPPLFDQQLRHRLQNATCRYQKALLLMRNTGLRIGELINLEFNCVRTDIQNNKFLKVPLGKLNNERLVPLDNQTFQLIINLQKIANPYRSHLLVNHAGRKSNHTRLVSALRQACDGLPNIGRVTTHQLRHTYATSLVNAGMSLVSIMKLLGHRDFAMTLRYTQITQETVRKEYQLALVELQNKYPAMPLSSITKSTAPDPLKLLSDVIRCIQKISANDSDKKQTVKALTKRIKRIQDNIRDLSSSSVNS